MKKQWLAPITLENEIVRLVPLQLEHEQALLEAASDGKLWELWYTSVPAATNIRMYLETALEQQANGSSLPFLVIDQKTEKVIGATRYCHADASNRRLEIGYTWYAKSYQRTGVNTACKYLLLRHAFETLDVIAVQFMTNWFNFKSRAAIQRIGAKQDGIIRNHRIDQNGNIRDTVLFSIIREEWQTVKFSLAYEMERRRMA